ncbi:MAG TPA: hypothetical protein VHQ98_04780 [Gaiellaceae bacterium]|jgi:hypothetical protein|nr:hypothetical protein [Gaiellaceae bacterium]
MLDDGTLNVGASSDNVADSNISHTANSGVYCCTNLPFLPSNAVAAVRQQRHARLDLDRQRDPS